jgi:predicted Fe-Mo cluster-binding NifX family protein
MKICITSQGKELSSPVDPRFGRCAYFIIIETDTMELEVIENNSALASGGAGVQSGQLVTGKGVKAVLTGNVGPNAFDTLTAGGIQIITGVSGTVEDAIKKYQTGDFTPQDNATVGNHHGMKFDK